MKALKTFFGIILVLLLGVAAFTFYDKYFKEDTEEGKKEEKTVETDNTLSCAIVSVSDINDTSYIIDMAFIDDNLDILSINYSIKYKNEKNYNTWKDVYVSGAFGVSFGALATIDTTYEFDDENYIIRSVIKDMKYSDIPKESLKENETHIEGVKNHFVDLGYQCEDNKENSTKEVFLYKEVTEEEQKEILGLLSMLLIDPVDGLGLDYLYGAGKIGEVDILNGYKTYLAIQAINKEYNEENCLEKGDKTFPADIELSRACLVISEEEVRTSLKTLFGNSVTYTPENFVGGVDHIQYSHITKMFYVFSATGGSDVEVSRGTVAFTDYKNDNNTLTFVETIGYTNVFNKGTIYPTYEAAIRQSLAEGLDSNKNLEEIHPFLDSYKFTFQKQANSYYFVSIEKINK